MNRRGDMKKIETPGSKDASVLSRKALGQLEDGGRNRLHREYSHPQILLEGTPGYISVMLADGFAENTQLKRVRQLHLSERGHEYRVMDTRHDRSGDRGMRFHQVKRYQETRIGVGRQ